MSGAVLVTIVVVIGLVSTMIIAGVVVFWVCFRRKSRQEVRETPTAAVAMETQTTGPDDEVDADAFVSARAAGSLQDKTQCFCDTMNGRFAPRAQTSSVRCGSVFLLQLGFLANKLWLKKTWVYFLTLQCNDDKNKCLVFSAGFCGKKLPKVAAETGKFHPSVRILVSLQRG